MSENKTKENGASVDAYFAAIVDDLLAQLGKHKMAKACLSIRKLGDVDLNILSQLVKASVADVRRRYP